MKWKALNSWARSIYQNDTLALLSAYATAFPGEGSATPTIQVTLGSRKGYVKLDL